MIVCSICKQEKDDEDFSYKNKNLKIKTSRCKTCVNDYSKNHYKNNKSKYLNRTRSGDKAFRERKDKLWIELKSTFICVSCNEDDIDCLDFHHLNPEDKDFNVSSLRYRNFTHIMNEIKKCVVLCSNCHRKFHAGNEKIVTLVESYKHP